jgi:hypothetical protein
MTDATPEVPLIYTSLGNLPVASLRYEYYWEDSPESMKFTESYFKGDEMVKSSTHLYLKKGLDLFGEQGGF